MFDAAINQGARASGACCTGRHQQRQEMLFCGMGTPGVGSQFQGSNQLFVIALPDICPHPVCKFPGVV